MDYQTQYNNEQMKNNENAGKLLVFDTIAQEDRDATIRDGQARYRDVHICRVYRAGDQQSAVVWNIDEIKREQPAKFLQVKDQYEAWLKGQTDEPLNGTSIRNWPGCSKAWAETLWVLNIRTVEALSQVPDNLLPNIGMGARALRDKAKAYVDGAGNIGKIAEQLGALNARVQTMEESLAEKDALLADKDKLILELTKKLGEPVKRGPGRPRKAEEQDEAA